MRVLAPISMMALTVAAVGGIPPAAASAGAVSPRPVVFAAAPAGASKPDDITAMRGVLYVTYQNNAGADGSPTGSRSTVVAFGSSGAVTRTWSIPGRVDGLTADPRHDRIFATSNEDLHSSIFLITPTATTVQHLRFSPDPAQKGSDGSNGGADSVSLGADGTVYVAHSNPDLKLPAPDNPAAVYRMSVAGTSATLTPVFGVNDTAAVINPAAGAPAKAPLGLTDPDSNRIIATPDGDMLIQDGQADSKLVFATHLSSGSPVLTQLNLVNAGAKAGGPTPQLDDIERVTGPGTLYMVDQGSGKIYRMDTATVTPGTYFVSQPKPSTGDLPNHADVATLNIHTGTVTDLHTGMISPKGLLFIPAPTPPPTTTTTAATAPPTTPTTGTAAPDIPTAVPAGTGGLGAPTSAATIRTEIGIGILGLLLLAAGAAGLIRRRPQRR